MAPNRRKKKPKASVSAGSDRSNLATPNKATELDQAGNYTDEHDVKAAIVDHSASDTDMTGNVAKLYMGKNKQGAGAKDLTIPADSAEHVLEPARRLPARPAEGSWGRKRNAFQEPNSTRIPREDILAIYPTEKAWRTAYTAALSNNAFARNLLMTYILFHNAVKNNEIGDVLHRGEQLSTGQWPYTAMPAEVKENYVDWLNWLACLDKVTPNALRHYNWMVLLEREYKAAEPVWTRFWGLNRELEHAESRCGFTFKVMPPALLLEEMDRIEMKMAAHNRKRHFLQRAMIAGKEWVSRMYTSPPMWVDWGQLVQDIVAAGLQDDTDDGLHSDETRAEYESGHVSDPEATESDEEFEL
ncbi:hypothetical protein PV04_00808 [Phialophora macrospora]|uniref:Uncharacterized protein n=1 Tax=Phialophora macrospora TaxID=1851006 RepID=A0A0D2D4X0_9EURO|nr:hypothetical protein PV04_00808 [Phialophora macrospora]